MRIAVVYATRYGHSAKVAREVARIAGREGVESDLFDVRALPGSFDLVNYDGAVLLGSVHFGRHARALERFASRNRAALSGMWCAFVSISGAAISEEGRGDAAACIDEFVRRTGWVPNRTAAFGGAFAYTKYGFIVRFVMRRIAAKHGRDTDTSHDHVYTDWEAVDAFAREYVEAAAAAANCTLAVAAAVA